MDKNKSVAKQPEPDVPVPMKRASLPVIQVPIGPSGLPGPVGPPAMIPVPVGSHAPPPGLKGPARRSSRLLAAGHKDADEVSTCHVYDRSPTCMYNSI